MKKIYLAIDIGASSGRHIAAWLEDGRIMTREVYRFSNGAEMKDGHLCWDLAHLEHEVLAGLAAAHARGFTPQSSAIDTWGVDYVFFDKETKAMRRLPYNYRDTRTVAAAEKVLAFVCDAFLQRHSKRDDLEGRARFIGIGQCFIAPLALLQLVIQ